MTDKKKDDNMTNALLNELQHNANPINTLCQFYVILKDINPTPIYKETHQYHVDYIDDIMILNEYLNDKKYRESVDYLKSSLLAKRRESIKQGRIYTNILNILEHHLEAPITKKYGKFLLFTRRISEQTILEYRITKKSDKEKLKIHVKSPENTINDGEKEKEYNRFLDILKKWESADRKLNERRLEFMYKVIKKDIKTDPLTLHFFNDSKSLELYQIMRIAKEKTLPYKYQELTHFKTNGSHFFVGNKKIPVKDFRVPMLTTIVNYKKE